jgi:hypothetical protein
MQTNARGYVAIDESNHMAVQLRQLSPLESAVMYAVTVFFTIVTDLLCIDLLVGLGRLVPRLSGMVTVAAPDALNRA